MTPDPSRSLTDEEAIRYLEPVASQLGEHFEAVQLLISWPSEGGGTTSFLARGCGNWYARMGMAHQFIESDQAQDFAKEIAKALPDEQPPYDDGEEWKS